MGQASSRRSGDLEKHPQPVLPTTSPSRRIDSLKIKNDELKRKDALVCIQPHTDDGGDAYYIGDAYHEGLTKSEENWAIDTTERPYLSYVKKVSTLMPHLKWLAHWMEVTCSPPKWKFIEQHDQNRIDRAKHCKVCVMDFGSDQEPQKHIYTNTTTLKEALDTSPQHAEKGPDRLLIVEDLSRDVVELLGAKYDIDPLFFVSHLGDYLFHNTRDPWVELPDLDVDARKRSFFTLQYLRARYFTNPDEFKGAEKESGLFNVLRRLDSDRSAVRLANGLLDLAGACVTLTRTKTSLWTKPSKDTDEPVLAILLVDPTVSPGFPLWNGPRPFESTPSMKNVDSTNVGEPLKPSSLFDDAILWSSKIGKEELENIHRDPKCFAIPMLRLVLADWRTVLKYMTTMLGKIEWEFERPHWGEMTDDIDASLKKLSPWRRNMHYYKGMVAEAIDRLFPPHDRTQFITGGSAQWAQMGGDSNTHSGTPTPDAGILSLLYDFRLVQQLMEASQQRIEGIQAVATNTINIEEARRAVQQNKHLARLTFLATLFIPLNFTSSFLSMSPGFASHQSVTTVWLFFALGVPLTLFALIVVDITNPKSGLIVTRLRKLGVLKAKTEKNPPGKTDASEKYELGKTIPFFRRAKTGAGFSS